MASARAVERRGVAIGLGRTIAYPVEAAVSILRRCDDFGRRRVEENLVAWPAHLRSASAVRGPRHIVRRNKTPLLDPQEARQLDAIDMTTVIGLRDRALIGLMVYSFARIGAAIGMRVDDVYAQNRRLWVRLHEKGAKQHAMRCHHNLEA